MTNSTATKNSDESTSLEQYLPSRNPAPLAGWQSLPDTEKAFVVAYVEGGYSAASAAETLGLTPAACRKMLNNPVVRKAVTEVQESLGEIDFLNERWVKEQIMLLYPKLVGEEAVPFVDNQGIQVEAKRFYPEVAFRVLEYVSPKQQKGAGNGGVAVQVNIDLGALGITHG